MNNDLPRCEEDWQAKATAIAIAGARRIISSTPSLINTPAGRLSDSEWGWITAAVIFGWVRTRAEQAISEGSNIEELVRSTGFDPDPSVVAAVTSILPTLCDKAGIDWSQPLAAWSKDTMTDFLLSAWSLINKAEIVRDHGPSRILKPAEIDWKTGDPIPPF